MSFIEYLRLCIGLGLSLIPILAFAFGIAWLVTVPPLHGPIAVALAIAAIIFAGPALACLAGRIMDLIAP